jgi:periodic tryptophan protein 2
VLAGHRETIREAWFSATQESFYTVSRDGAFFRWEYVPKPQQNGGLDDEIQEAVAEQWRIVQRDYFMQPDAKLKCACFHSQLNLLTVCFNNGIFSIYELPTFTNIHTLSIASSPISNVTINKSGEWLAFGSTKTGQLLVWEHASESQILKQSSHLDTMTSLSYSPDSNRIITGADDGLIKIWDVNSGFHIATFTEHNSAVTASQYSRRGNILFTSSLDGSVRAWDMLRFRNFRTFTAPTRLSFSSLAIDPSAEIVCAASHDSFDIHIWSVQTGQLLDQLAGHEGPISALAFTPDGSGTLASGSWDQTVRLWSVFSRTPTSEPLPLTSNILCIAIHPDSLELCAATLDGALTFFNLTTSTESSVLDSSRRDISGGRSLTSRRTAASSPATKNFTTMTYSADGTCLLAAGISKYICLYSVSTLTLIKKFTVSINLSLSGTQELLNSSAILSNGQPRDQIDAYSSEDPSDLSDRIDTSLPGAKRGTRDAVSRKLARPEVRVTALQFSPTGRSFCAASTEGLLIYSLDIAGASDSSNMDFDPFDLAMDVTPQNIHVLLSSGQGPKREHEYLKALIMAFRLADPSLVRLCYLSIPYEQIPLLVPQIPRVYLTQLLRFIGSELSTEGQPGSGRHIEFHLVFLQSLLQHHGRYIKDHPTQLAPEMRGVMRGVDGVGRAVRRMSEQVGWEVEYLCNQPRKGGVGIAKAAPAAQGTLDDDGDVPGRVNTIVIGNHTAGEDADNEDGWIGLD